MPEKMTPREAAAEATDLKVEVSRLRRLLNLKDDAFAMLYNTIYENRHSWTQEHIAVIEHGFAFSEIEAGKERNVSGTSNFVIGMREAQIAELEAENKRLQEGHDA